MRLMGGISKIDGRYQRGLWGVSMRLMGGISEVDERYQ